MRLGNWTASPRRRQISVPNGRFSAIFNRLRQENNSAFVGLREAIDRYFRARVLGDDTNDLLADLLDSLSRSLRQATASNGLDVATVHSTLRLLGMPEEGRMKICGNCGWLFLDRSKNKSRAWCDMAVCGNRAKANRHYRRKKERSAP